MAQSGYPNQFDGTKTRLGGKIPGYSGHVPGVVPVAHCASKIKQANDTAAGGPATPKPERQARLPVEKKVVAPGNCGHTVTTFENGFFVGSEHVHRMHGTGEAHHGAAGNQAVDKAEKGVSTRPAIQGLLGWSHQETNPSRASPRSAGVAVAGYAGYVPGKTSENVIGRTVTVANTYAQEERSLAHEQQHTHQLSGRNQWRRPTAPGVAPRRGSGTAAGKDIPGYTGYIPSKNPESQVFGKNFTQTNSKAEKHNKWIRGYGEAPTPSGCSEYSTSKGSGSVVSGSRASGNPRNARSGRSSKTPSAFSEGGVLNVPSGISRARAD